MRARAALRLLAGVVALVAAVNYYLSAGLAAPAVRLRDGSGDVQCPPNHPNLGKALLAVTTCNHWDMTQRLLQGLETHGTERDLYEAMLFDDASSDGTLEGAAAMGVRVSHSEDPQGVTVTWNRAYATFKRECFGYLFNVNNDIIIPKGAIASMMEDLQRHPEIGLLGPMTTRAGIGKYSLAALPKQPVEENYPQIVPLLGDLPANTQAVQDAIAADGTGPEVVEGRILGFFLAGTRYLTTVELQKDELFKSLTANLGQESRFMKYKQGTMYVSRRAFVFHHKGTTVTETMRQDGRMDDLSAFHAGSVVGGNVGLDGVCVGQVAAPVSASASLQDAGGWTPVRRSAPPLHWQRGWDDEYGVPKRLPLDRRPSRNPYSLVDREPQPMRWRGLELEIEPLLPGLHFRPKYMSGRSENFANRDHLQLLPAQVDVAAAGRRILVDIGSATFDQTVGWMLVNYPVDFHEVHVFSSQVSEWGSVNPGVIGKQLERRAKATGVDLSLATLSQRASAVRVHNFWLDTCDWDKVGYASHKDVVRVLREELRVTSDDFLVIVMDVNGIEWELLPRLREAGVLPLVAELFVKVHYQHPDLDFEHWGLSRLAHSVEEADAALRQLREEGVFAHMWPAVDRVNKKKK